MKYGTSISGKLTIKLQDLMKVRLFAANLRVRIIGEANCNYYLSYNNLQEFFETFFKKLFKFDSFIPRKLSEQSKHI